MIDSSVELKLREQIEKNRKTPTSASVFFYSPSEKNQPLIKELNENKLEKFLKTHAYDGKEYLCQTLTGPLHVMKFSKLVV